MEKCPLCQSELEQGFVSVHGTLLGYLLVGMSYQHCWFKGDESGDEVVLKSRERRQAFKCQACGFVGIYAKEARFRWRDE